MLSIDVRKGLEWQEMAKNNISAGMPRGEAIKQAYADMRAYPPAYNDPMTDMDHLINDMLALNPAKRPTMAEVNARLNAIQQQQSQKEQF